MSRLNNRLDLLLSMLALLLALIGMAIGGYDNVIAKVASAILGTLAGSLGLAALFLSFNMRGGPR